MRFFVHAVYTTLPRLTVHFSHVIVKAAAADSIAVLSTMPEITPSPSPCPMQGN